MKRFKGTTIGVQFKGVMNFQDIMEMQNKAVDAINVNEGSISIFSGMNTSVSSTGMVITEGILLWGGFPATFEGASSVNRANKKYFVITRESVDERIVVMDGQPYDYFAYDYYQAHITEQVYSVGTTFQGKDVVGCIPYFFRSNDFPTNMLLTDLTTGNDGDVIEYINRKGVIYTVGDVRYVLTGGVLMGDEALAVALAGFYDNGMIYFGNTIDIAATFVNYTVADSIAPIPINDRLAVILGQLKKNSDSVKTVAYTADYADLQNKLEDVSALAVILTEVAQNAIPLNGSVSEVLSLLRVAISTLKRVCYSANFFDLEDYPYKMSDFYNDVFIEPQSEIKIISDANQIPTGWQSVGTGTIGSLSVTYIQRTVQAMFTLTLNQEGGTVGITPLAGMNQFVGKLSQGNHKIWFKATYPNLFRGWFQNISGTMTKISEDNPYELNLISDRELTAMVIVQNQVTYGISAPNPTLGSIAISAPNPVWTRYIEFVTATGAVLLAKAPEGTQFEFAGFNINGVVQPYDTYSQGIYSKTISPTGAMSVLAVYQEKTEVVMTINPEGAGSVTINPLPPYKEGDIIRISAVPNGINRFLKWAYGSSESQVNPLTYVVAQGKNAITAMFVNVYRVEVRTEDMTVQRGQVQINDGALAAEASANIDMNTETTINAVSAEGWSFQLWMNNHNIPTYSNPLKFIPTSDVVYTAKFTRNYYLVTVTADPIDYGVVSGGGTYEHNAECTLKATPSTGKHFVEWRKYTSDFEYTVLSTDLTFAFNVLEKSVIEGVFALNNYRVEVSSSVGGTAIGSGNYDYGSTATLIATADLYYSFEGWYEDNVKYSTQTNYQFVVSRDRNMVAKFVREQATITIEQVPANTTVVKGAGTFDKGTTQTLSYTKVEGVEFLGWYEGQALLATSDQLVLTLVRDITVIAKFNVLEYTIQATASNEARGAVSGGGKYIYNQTATLRASAFAGNTFVNWTENGLVVSTNSVYSFEVTSNRNLVANFSPLTCTVTAASASAVMGKAEGSGSYPYNSRVIVIATPNTGYRFVNWTMNGGIVSTESSYIFTAVDNVELIANFELIQ